MAKSKCSLKYISAILYCASQNRDNRQCCQDLDLNSSQLMVSNKVGILKIFANFNLKAKKSI